MMKRFLFSTALSFSLAPALAQEGGSFVPGGSSTLTPGSTSTSGFSAGQLLYSNGSTLQALGQGVSGQFLQSNGAGATPNWASASGSGTVNSGTQYQVGCYLTTGSAISGCGNLTLNGATAAIGANGTPGNLLVWGNIAGQSSTLSASTYSGATSFVMPYSGTANDPLLSAASTATLSNKTFSGATNVWQGGVIGATYGGTGVNNGSSTITLGGSLTFSGAYTFAGTLTGATAITFPTSGTLLANPMTAPGDLILGGTAGAPSRLAIGSNNTCLTSNGATASWGSCGTASPGGASGQIQINNAGAFGGSANLTWSSPALTIGAQGTTLGQLALASSAAFTTTLQPSASATASYTLTLPPAAATAAQCLQTTAAGAALTFGSCGGAATLAVGSTATSGGAAGQIMYDTGSLLQEQANFVWDSTNHSFNLFNVTGTNYEQFNLGWSSNVAMLAISKGGTGTLRNFELTVGGTNILDYGVQTASTLTLGANGTANVVTGGGGVGFNKSGSGANAVIVAGSSGYGWASAGSVTTIPAADTSLCRAAAGVVEVGSGSSCATTGTLRAKVVGTPTGYTVATLPTGTTGDRTYVTNSTSCTKNGTLTGSGSIFCAVIYNGSAWVGE